MTTAGTEPAAGLAHTGPGGLVGVPPVVRLRLDISYDGAGFCGWARQPGLRSVQAEVEGALRAVLRIDGQIPVHVGVAGRTDAGVHAVGQVCHADVPAHAWPRDEAVATRRRLNGLLPPDVRVRQVRPAAPGFDARWSATWRCYEYLVADDPAGQDPRSRGHVLWYPRAVDVVAMDRAAQGFLGEHDFAAYCRARPGASTVRTVLSTGWERIGGPAPSAGSGAGSAGPRPAAGDSGAGPAGAWPAALIARFTICADAFCHSMVRRIVGALLAVGEGRWDAAQPASRLAAGVPVPGITTAPAHGLTLAAVGYPPQDELGAQAQRARRWRGR